MVFHWSLSDSKSPQVSRTLLSILADLNNAVVWIVSTWPPTSKSSSLFNNTLITVPKAPILLTSFSHSIPWSLNDSKSPQVSRTLLSTLVELNNTVVWMISARLPISNSSTLLTSFWASLGYIVTKKYIYIHIHPPKHTYAYIYMCVCMRVCAYMWLTKMYH